MCGIAGYATPKVKDGRALLEQMNQAMVHRGPDDSGVYIQKDYGLAMRRLSIIDLAGGHQPVWNEDQTVAVVFNGEIYNFQKLRQELLQKGHSFTTHSDTEVLVHLYEEEGTKCVGRLNGMFAFAIFDRKQDLFFLARDRMGEKPLHYYFKDGHFLFASEIKSLLTCPWVEKILNLEALDEYLTYEYVPAPHTIYRDIYKLRPGHFLIFQKGKLEIRPYWKPSFKHPSPALPEKAAVATLRNHLRRSVEIRKISDVPLGSFLSGGLDSSLIAAFLAQSSSQKIQTFNIAFEETSFNESHYAQEAARHLGTEHHEERLTTSVMRDLLPAILEKLDEPFADGSLVPTFLLSRFTRQHVKVALSGDGSDELFAGYPTYQAHQLARWIPGFLGPLANRLAEALPVSDENISFDFKMRRFTAGLSYPLPERNQIWLGSFDENQKRKLFSEAARGKLRDHNALRLVCEHDSECDSSFGLDRVSHIDLRFFLEGDQLFRVDRTSMMNSLEVRAPFLDHELVEFICSLPPSLRLHGMTTKYLLKEAARGILPDSIIDRPKKGFGMPIAKWIKGDFRKTFEETFSRERIQKVGLFNPDYIQILLSEHLRGVRDHRKLLWTLFVFESWRNLQQPQIPIR